MSTTLRKKLTEISLVNTLPLLTIHGTKNNPGNGDQSIVDTLVNNIIFCARGDGI